MADRNSVVANAIEAAKRAQNAKDGHGVADVLVEFTAPDGNGLVKIQRRMSPTGLETWLRKTGNSAEAEGIWLALARRGAASFQHPETKVTVTAL